MHLLRSIEYNGKAALKDKIAANLRINFKSVVQINPKRLFPRYSYDKRDRVLYLKSYYFKSKVHFCFFDTYMFGRVLYIGIVNIAPYSPYHAQRI